MIHRVFFRWLAVVAFVALGGCAQQPASCSVLSPAISFPAPVMVSPAPGATGLPTSGFSVQVANGRGVANHETLRLVDQNQQTLLGPAFALLPPPPAPAGPGPIANEAAAVPQLAPHTTYTAFVDGASPLTPIPCSSQMSGGPYSYRLGTFTTQ